MLKEISIPLIQHLLPGYLVTLMLRYQVIWNLSMKQSGARLSNSWKAPGLDGICGFWWKAFHQACELLRQAVWKMLKGDADSIPTWFVKGRTVLIPKEGYQGRPDQYRPINCLNTGYKLLTAVMMKVLYEYVMCYLYLPQEQRAIRRGKRGCVNALMINSMVAKEAMVHCRDLSVAWIDYQKAYDRVPHDWLDWMLSGIKAPF